MARRPIALKLDRGAAILLLPNQRCLYNQVIESEANTGVYYFCDGRYHHLRKTNKNMLNYAPSEKNDPDRRTYNIYAYTKATMEGTLDRGLVRLGFDDGKIVDIDVAFSYRIADLPRLVDEIQLYAKRVAYEKQITTLVAKGIHKYIQERGLGEIMQKTLRSDLAAESGRLYKQIAAEHALAYLGIELMGLKITAR